METKIYYNDTHFTDSFKRLQDLRESGEHYDISIFVSNKTIRAHKIILASMSVHFSTLIYDRYSNDDDGKKELTLDDIQYEILSALINYMYTGKIEISLENVYEIFNGADLYNMRFIQQKCLDFLEENLEVDNCVKIWAMAYNCNYEKTKITTGNYIYSNLAIACNTKEFLGLCSNELLNLFKLWPKIGFADSIITAASRWASEKDNWEETVIIILNDIPHTRISQEYLDNNIPKNKLFQKSIICKNWLMKIYRERSKTRNSKLEQEEHEPNQRENRKSENEKLESEQTEPIDAQKFTKFLNDKPIIFMKQDGNEFYKYNLRDGEFDLYNKLTDKLLKYPDSDCKPYKHWIYVVANKCCKRFAFDELNQTSYESVFLHNHGPKLSAVVLNNTMHIFGGDSSLMKGTSIDLTTKQVTRNFNLLNNRSKAGVAVIGGAIYVCGGLNTNIVELFDPRDCRSSKFGNIPINIGSDYSTAALSDQIYCASGGECKMLDVRTKKCIEVRPPVNGGLVGCLVSSYGKIYANTGTTIYEYNHNYESWKSLGSFPELVDISKMLSFE